MFKTISTEAILFQDVFVDRLSKHEKDSLARITQEKLDRKLENTEIFSACSIKPSINILSDLSIDTYSTTAYDGFIFNKYGYVNKTVKTPKGTTVRAFDVKEDMTATEAYMYVSKVRQRILQLN